MNTLAVPARVAAWLTLAAPAVAGVAPTVTVEPARIVAGPDLTWSASVTITNPTADSLRVDRIELVVEDRDPGETRAPRESRLPLPPGTGIARDLAPGGANTFRFKVPAPAESAAVRIEARLRDSRCDSILAAGTADALPGPASRRYPSELLGVNGRRVEVVRVTPDVLPARGAPGVLLVHGHGHHARQMLRAAMRLAQGGYVVMLVSMPGYGLSEGPADFMGPRTIAALAAALDRLEQTPGVDTKRTAAWGVSRGATAVTLLAERRPELAAVIAQAGLYDVAAAARSGMDPAIRANLIAEAGDDSLAWRERSPGLAVERLKAPILVMHGENDANAPAAQAHAFVRALQDRGAPVEAHFFPGAGHALPRDDTSLRALLFLDHALRR